MAKKKTDADRIKELRSQIDNLNAAITSKNSQALASTVRIVTQTELLDEQRKQLTAAWDKMSAMQTEINQLNEGIKAHKYDAEQSKRKYVSEAIKATTLMSVIRELHDH